ncbi:uncharacterized protein LOC130745077 [Lotus japonicus]|uniref:uncharacterized protein LOC130745077 n=1 Tax=Lotus japonicus TaxID=34305 RepID=UPI00258FC985|nr:uncharacterized protein LOC130745077 [Lotus japonicus]
MESRVDDLERSVTSMKEMATEQFEELRRLIMNRERRRTRGRSNTPRFRQASRERDREASSHSGSRTGSRFSDHSRERFDHPHRVHLRAVTGRRVDIPMFDGSDAYGWINRVERFFQLSRVGEEERLEMVMIAMEGKALGWFQWWEEQAPERAWEPFKHALIRRFQPTLVQNPFGPLLSIKQKGSVMAYRESFEEAAAPMRGADREILKGVFQNGLQEEIRAEMKLYPAADLAGLMDRALLIEEKNSALRGGKTKEEDKRGWKDKGGIGVKFSSNGEKHTNSSSSYVGKNTAGGQGQEGKTTQSKESNEGSGNEAKVPERKWNGGQRLSQSELQERSRKGLCFKCGEKWGKEHVCTKKHYQFILIEGEEDEEEEEIFEEAEDGEFILEGKVLQLSLNSKEGLTSNQSFKIRGRIGGREVLILVDCGATSNFISQELVAELGLQVIATTEYVVEVGNGAKERNSGVCKNLKIEAQGIPIVQHFFLLSLGGTELVLGMDWLASLGNIKANFKNLTLQWEVHGRKMRLQGDHFKRENKQSMRSSKKLQRRATKEEFLAYDSMCATNKKEEMIPQQLKEVLVEFPEVFKTP